MDFSEGLSMLTDSLLNDPLSDFNAESFYSDLLCEDSEISPVETTELSCEEISLVCEDEGIYLEDEPLLNNEHGVICEKVMPKQLEDEKIISTFNPKLLKDKKIRSTSKCSRLIGKAKTAKLNASNKSHQEVSNMIEKVYRTQDEAFILHSSFSKITKIQKLDQVLKFHLFILKNGYTPNK